MLGAVAPGAARGGGEAGADGHVGLPRQLRQAVAVQAAQRFALPFGRVGHGLGRVAVGGRRRGGGQARPETAQQAGGRWRLGLAAGLVDVDVADQVQALAGAGGGDVQQAVDFVGRATGLARAEVALSLIHI